MRSAVSIPFDTDLEGYYSETSGKWALLFAHGTRSSINEGLIPTLSKKLEEKHISFFAFNFPFRQQGINQPDGLQQLDEAYQAAWNFVTAKYPQKRWVLAGHDIGSEVAIRASGLIMTEDGSIPPVIAIAYPLYPPNRPEMVNAGSLGAVMGEILFIQPEESNQGSFVRVRNQVQMMVPHADLSKIKGANHDLDVKNKSTSKVAYWIANDVERFLKNQF